MDLIKTKLKLVWEAIIKSIKEYYGIIRRPFDSFKNTIMCLSSILSIFILTVFIISVCRGGFFIQNTDDIIQYYPFMEGFIKKIKNGEFSLYDNSFFMGTSSFAYSYYIPLDVFTLLTLLFSYIMPTGRAYCLINLSKILFGGLLIAYFLRLKGFKNKTLFLYSLVFSLGGLLATECVFPVYWSLLVYIPLGAIVVEKYINNHKLYFLIPIYTFTIILYDFYIAYMLLAFLMIYLVIEKLSEKDHHLFGKQSIFKEKYLYIDILSTFALIILGLMMSMVVFLPSYKYIVNKTTREVYKEVLWKYSPVHYMNVISTFFITSNPINILLSHGDYLRNHCSMFITLLGLYYLIVFFFTKGYKNNILKVFIVLLNVMMCIPLISMIMTGTKVGYIRWFFIVYFFNLYCSAYSFEYYENKVNGILKRILFISLFIFGTVFISYLFFKRSDFTTYTTSPFRIVILVFFYVFIGLYVIAIFLPHQSKITYVLALLESICSAMMVFVNVGNTYSYYEYCENQFDDIEQNLLNNTSYSHTNAYRAALLTNESNYFVNVSAVNNKFNTNQFFHSFYDSTSNPIYNSILDTKGSYWSRRETYMFSGPFALIDGVKYGVIPNSYMVDLPSCYNLKFKDSNYSYYELEGLKPFILYEEINQYRSYNRLRMALNLLNYGYIFTEDENFDVVDEIINMYDLKKTSGESTIFKNMFSTVTLSGNLEYIDNEKFGVYNISNAAIKAFKGNDYLYVPSYEPERNTAYINSYILDTENNKHYSFYGLSSNTTQYTPQAIYTKLDTEYVPNLTLYTFDMNGIINKYEELNKFEDENFTLDGSTMSISLKCDSKEFGRVLKTNFTYSSEWEVNDSRFKTINIDGGYLGIVIPKNISSVNIVLNFKPDGFALGANISAFTISSFGVISMAIFIYQGSNKKEYFI